MLSPKSKQILQTISIFLLILVVIGHEAGLQFEKHTIAKALDIIGSRIPKAVEDILGISSTADAQTTESKAAETAKIGNYEVKEDPAAVNVKSFGAKGDGVTDDTEAIQKAVNAVPGTGGKVFIPAGTYMVEALQSVRLKSRVTLLMAKGAVLKAIPNGAEHYAVLTIENVSDVTVVGGVIQGERRRHIGNKGQWGTGIQISGAKDITIQGTAAIDCWGDGFYIGTETFTGTLKGETMKVPENVRLIDVRADNNRRQGISLIAGRNIEIIRPLLTNTKGIEPSAGLDIEPNDKTDLVENITVTDAITKGNAGAGILINLSELFGTNTPANIKVLSHSDEGSERGMFIIDSSTSDNITPGTVLVENPEWVNSTKNGLSISNHDYRSYNIIIRNPRITGANRGGSRFDPFIGSAIAIYHDRGNIPARTGIIGNVTIYNPVINNIDNGSELVTPFHFWDDVPGRTIQKLAIIDPLMSGYTGKKYSLDGVRTYISNTPEKTER